MTLLKKRARKRGQDDRFATESSYGNRSLKMMTKSENIIFYTEFRLKSHLLALTAFGISR